MRKLTDSANDTLLTLLKKNLMKRPFPLKQPI